jgi:hypothetical protein
MGAYYLSFIGARVLPYCVTRFSRLNAAGADTPERTEGVGLLGLVP